MEFRDLKAQYQAHKDAMDQAIREVLENTNFISGRQVAELESRLAQYVGVKHCIACANGTDALQLSLMAWGVENGDAVFVPDFTFFSSGEVVPLVGAVPVFVDVEEETFNIDPQKLEAAIERTLQETSLRPRVIVAVNLFGQPAKYEDIRNIADRYGMYVLEDSAQGFGGRIGDKRACSFGDIATTSFFPAKPLGCYGDGGAIFTDHDDWADKLRSLRVHGKGSDKYDNVCIGMNSRLDTIHAAILNAKMDFFDDEIEKCNQIARWYHEGLRVAESVKVPDVLTGYYSSWAQYTILLKNESHRNHVMEALKEEGIPTAVYYKKAMHAQTAFEELQPLKADCPVTEDIVGRCLSLPMSAYLTKQDVEKICGVIGNM